MGSFISVPEWADALFNALEEISTAAFITSKVERGEICPETTLSELGIKPRSLTALTKSINGVIRAHRRRNSPAWLPSDARCDVRYCFATVCFRPHEADGATLTCLVS
jgi:hypothetical protein